jgi:thiol-disulfide isomerase/thioredoxin
MDDGKKTSSKSTRSVKSGTKSAPRHREPEKSKSSPKEKSTRDREVKDRDTKPKEKESAPARETKPKETTKDKEQSAPPTEKETPNKVRVVNDLETYEKLRDDGLVVIDYNTSWCGPCRSFAPVFEEIAANYPGVTFLSVDAESFDHEDTSSVKSVPTFRLFLNGVMRREFTGIDREKLERYIERYSVQIIINGRTQRTFPRDVKDRVTRYMDMLQPE